MQYSLLYQRPVTPLAGVWIEIMKHPVIPITDSVTPLAGVWIEIVHQIINNV